MELMTDEEFSKLSGVEQKDAMIEALHYNNARLEELVSLQKDSLGRKDLIIARLEKLQAYSEEREAALTEENELLTEKNELLESTSALQDKLIKKLENELLLSS